MSNRTTRVAPVEGRCERSLRRRRRIDGSSSPWAGQQSRISIGHRYRPMFQSGTAHRDSGALWQSSYAADTGGVVTPGKIVYARLLLAGLVTRVLRKPPTRPLDSGGLARPSACRHSGPMPPSSGVTGNRDPARRPNGEIVEPPGRETAVHAGHETLVAAVTSTDRPPLSRWCQPPPPNRDTG